MELNYASFILLTGFLVSLCYHCVYSENNKEVSDRYLDKPFPLPITIYGKNVTCVDKSKHKPGLYAGQTWTCEDMRVENRRMAYGYNPSKDKKCGETKGLNELAEVCREMMARMGAKKELWAAFVTNATCNYINEKRYMLKFSGPGYTWVDMNAGNGWIYTLRCMAIP